MKHTCHAKGCNVAVPRKILMCKPHWFMLPKPMRDAIWREYSPGQEQGKALVTKDYLEITDQAIEWLANHENKHLLCPHCKTVVDLFEDLTDKTNRKPATDDAAICIHCGTILVFESELIAHEATAAELASAPSRDRQLLLELQEKIRSRS